jgi:hypothetical protein
MMRVSLNSSYSLQQTAWHGTARMKQPAVLPCAWFCTWNFVIQTCLLLLLPPLLLLLPMLLLLQALLKAQHTLLEDITGATLQLSSTAAAAEGLGNAFSSLRGKGPLLLLVDNVFEAGGGITKMLPDLQATLSEG